MPCRTGHPASVTVSAAISFDGETPLVFNKPGVKINHTLRRSCRMRYFPGGNPVSRTSNGVFYHDSALAHKAKTVQDWCEANLPGIVRTWQRLSYDPYLYLLERTSGLSDLRRLVCPRDQSVRYCPSQCEFPRGCAEQGTGRVQPRLLRRAVDAFPKPLRACVKAREAKQFSKRCDVSRCKTV